MKPKEDFKSKIRIQGNSHVITIPSRVIKKYRLKENDLLDIRMFFQIVSCDDCGKDTTKMCDCMVKLLESEHGKGNVHPVTES